MALLNGLDRRVSRKMGNAFSWTFCLWNVVKFDATGIRLFHLHYWHNVLSPQAGRSKTRELIKYDPRNLSRVYWQDQQNNYWPIPYRNLALPPISLWEHDEAVRRLKAESQREVDENKLVAMVLQQRRLVEEARSKTARRRRRRQPPDDQCDLEADTGRLRVTQSGTTAQPNKQPRPLEGELTSSWLYRVAAANLVKLEELLSGLLDLHPGRPSCARTETIKGFIN